MAEDLGALGSWEAADLGERLSKFLVSPAKKSTISPPPPESFSDEPTTDPSASLRDDSVGRGGGTADDALNQVDQFLREALEKPRERLSILRMERDIEKFIRDPTQQQLEFQSLPTSYLRLAAHRVAQHYYLQSVAMPDNSSIDGSGSRIVLCKTPECRFPLVRLADVPVNLPDDDNTNNNTVVKLAIKQRPQKHSQNVSSASIHSSKTNHPKSVEERKEEYNRARARIFNNNSSIGFMEQSEAEEATLPDSFPLFSLVHDGRSGVEGGSGLNHGMVSCDPCTGSSIPYGNRTEDEPRYRVSNRVAIFRDREVDRKDPDYDRNYDRYMQRFAPGFGFNGGGPYAMQPMYTPVVNYNSEFPHFGLTQLPQISMDHQSRPILSGPWYGHVDVVMAPFGPTHATSSPYVHSSQYSVPPRHAMSFAHPHDHLFTQSHQQQHEASFGVARPR